VKKLWNGFQREEEEAAHKELLEVQKKAREVIQSLTSSTSHRKPRRHKIRRTPGLEPKQPRAASKKKSFGVSIKRKEEPVEQHTARIMVSKSYRIAEMPNLDFVPSATADETADKGAVEEYFNTFDTEEHEKDIERGPVHEVQRLDARVKKTMKRAHDELSLTKEASVLHLSKLAKLEDQLERVEELYDEMKADLANSAKANNADLASPPSSPSRKKQSTSSEKTATEADGPVVSSDTLKHPTLAGDDAEYLKLVDSFRKLYCQRCMAYDCQLHPELTDSEKPSLQLSYELGMSYEKENGTKTVEPKDSEQGADDNKKYYPEDLASLSQFHKQICRRFFLIYEGDVEQMAIAMQAPAMLVSEYVKEQDWQLPKENKIVPAKKHDPHPYYSIKNYNRQWYQQITNASKTIRPHFVPCVQEEEESEISCLQRGSFCTRACAWGQRSKNFFRGCDCKGSCTTQQCSCLGNGRECNPDICQCDNCTDPPGQPASRQKCRNDNIIMQRSVEVILGRSAIPNAGWGCFSKGAITKGEFLGEYVGEMITQDEAERRGRLYDIQKNSSLFMLSADFAVDADRKHNLLRYINHSSASPNTFPLNITVDGENRLGFFTCQDIPPQTELTFDYGYDTSVNNEFSLVTEKSVPWMNDKVNGSNKVRKSSKRRG